MDLTVIYIGIAFLITFAGAILVAIKLGESREKNKVAQSNIEASQKVEETAEAIINHTRGDGIAALDRLRKEADNH